MNVVPPDNRDLLLKHLGLLVSLDPALAVLDLACGSSPLAGLDITHACNQYVRRFPLITRAHQPPLDNSGHHD